MEKRLLLAVVLMTAAILITNILFPPPEPPAAVERADSVAVAAAPEPSAPVLPVPTATGQGEVGDTIVVESELYRLEFASVGGTLVGAELLEYPSYSSEG